MDAYRFFLTRIGIFFMLVGSFLFVLFVTSDLADKPDFDYLFVSMLVLGTGWIFYNRNRKRPTSAGRFRLLRRNKPEHKDKDKEKK